MNNPINIWNNLYGTQGSYAAWKEPMSNIHTV